MQYLVQSEDELAGVAHKVVELSQATPVVLLQADMGAGKTTLVKAICHFLGIKHAASSPTFSLVNEYEWGEKKIYHFDLYRIKDVEELYDIGFEEYLDSGYLCLIEWPDLASELLPSEFILVKIDVQENGRLFSLTHCR